MTTFLCVYRAEITYEECYGIRTEVLEGNFCTEGMWKWKRKPKLRLYFLEKRFSLEDISRCG